VGVSASPLLPGITENELEPLAAACKEAGALWFYSNVLFLMPSSARTFLPFMREKFPKLAKQYEQWFAKNGYAPEEYRKKISDRVRKVREKYGFATRPLEGLHSVAQPAQMKLGWDAAAISTQLNIR
jgi:DNA repair photolyase